MVVPPVLPQTSSEATLEVQPSGDQTKCRSKPLAKKCGLIATPIHHDERKKNSHTGSGVARDTKAIDVELKNDLLEMYTIDR